MGKCSGCGKKLGIFEGYETLDKEFCESCWKKRVEDNKIKKGEEIRRIQVICTPGHPNEVKLNDEVEIIAEVKVNRDITKGEEVKGSDIDEIKNFIISYPSNSGHITMFRYLDKWTVIFDFRYNKENIKKTLGLSKSFYESAKDDLATNRLIPFLENCWGSAELSSVCHMLSIGDKNKGHGENVKNFVTWSELGNVNKNHAKILSRLKDLRSLRYDLFFEPINDDLQEILKNVKEMMEDAEKLI